MSRETASFNEAHSSVYCTMYVSVAAPDTVWVETVKNVRNTRSLHIALGRQDEAQTQLGTTFQ